MVERRVAVTDDQFAVADERDLGRGVAGEDGLGVVPVRLHARAREEFEPGVEGLVVHVVAGDGVGELGHEEEVVLRPAGGAVVDGLEDAVAGPGAGRDGDGGAGGEGEGGGVDVEDAHEVGAEVREEEEFLRGVEDHLVGMWGGLSCGVGPGFGLGEVEALGEGEVCGVRVDGVGG